MQYGIQLCWIIGLWTFCRNRLDFHALQFYAPYFFGSLYSKLRGVIYDRFYCIEKVPYLEISLHFIVGITLGLVAFTDVLYVIDNSISWRVRVYVQLLRYLRNVRIKFNQPVTGPNYVKVMENIASKVNIRYASYDTMMCTLLTRNFKFSIAVCGAVADPGFPKGEGAPTLWGGGQGPTCDTAEN